MWGGNRRKPFEDTTDEDWENVLDLNLRAHVRSGRAVVPHMKAAGGGAILFVASIFGREAGGAGLSIYNATKSALISTAKIMALELAPAGIRVNSIAPGSIRFPGGSWDRRVREQPEQMKAFVAQNLPVGRFGKAEEVAGRGSLSRFGTGESGDRRLSQCGRRTVPVAHLKHTVPGCYPDGTHITCIL